MLLSKPTKPNLAYFLKHLLVVVGLVLIWRGVWYVLDAIDVAFFAGDHFWTALAGIVIGIAVLYVPDKDLKEIAKL
jgi:hypothetical protein